MSSTVMIVDDSPQFRAVAAELLAERGFDVVITAADGSQALAAVTDRCPDAILLDVNLPGQDGFTLAASLAAACPRARIVLTSAEITEVPARVLAGCPVAAFVAKSELVAADLRTLLQPADK